MNSAIITSAFGDDRLFFQHENMNNDFAIKRNWRNYVPRLNRRDRWGNRPANGWPQNDDTAEAWVRGSMFEFDCPFAWLLGNTITPIDD